MVLTSNFPPDSRVEKEAISLSEQGNNVHIVCYLNNGQSAYEVTKHYTIHRVKFSSFYRNKLSAAALILPSYFNKWEKVVGRLYKKNKYDVIHVHDLPLSKVGYHFKKKYGCKLVCDQHEFYSNWIKRTAHMNTLPGKIISLLSNWTTYEKKYLQLADLIVTVAEPLRENYINAYILPEEKIITVPNTPSKKIYNRQNVKDSIVNKYKDDFIIFYAGGIDILRGIDTAIKALPAIKNKIPNAKLLLCGKIIKPYDPFKTAEKYGVSDAVIFDGWVNESELPSYIAASDVCFFTPPATNDEINKTIATKIYQYAIMGKPVIVSEAKMMKEFVEKNNIGYSIKSGDDKAFAERVITLSSQSNFEANTYNFSSWEETVDPLLRAYNSFKIQK